MPAPTTLPPLVPSGQPAQSDLLTVIRCCDSSCAIRPDADRATCFSACLRSPNLYGCDTGGTTPNSTAPGGPPIPPMAVSPCDACGLQDIGACITCAVSTAKGFAEFMAVNTLIGLLLLLGVYLFFAPQINQAVTTAGKSAGKAAEVATLV